MSVGLRDSTWRRLEAGRAGNYIRAFGLRPGDKVIIWCRVSGRSQGLNGNPQNQATALRKVCEDCGAIVVDVFEIVGSGLDTGEYGTEEHLGMLARAAAKARKEGAILLAESTDRFIRPDFYHSNKCPGALPRTRELDILQEMTLGVQLMTLLDPDAKPREVKRYQTKRGQLLKNNKGGRPPGSEKEKEKNEPGYMKSRKERLLPKVLQLHNQGDSIRMIMRKTGLGSTSTVFEWIKRYSKE